MKGVSTLIASVLLILIVVTLAGLLISYSTSWIKGSTQTIENRSDTTVECSGAAMLIDEVYMSNGSSTANVRVTVKNTGSKDDLTITSGVLFNTSSINFSSNNLPIRDFDVGDIEIVTFSNVSIYKCQNLLSVSIGTNCGTASDTFKGTPKCAS